MKKFYKRIISQFSLWFLRKVVSRDIDLENRIAVELVGKVISRDVSLGNDIAYKIVDEIGKTDKKLDLQVKLRDFIQTSFIDMFRMAFVVREDIVEVKYKKLKYHIAYIRTPAGRIEIKIDRHHDFKKEPVIAQI